jgi:hypothetical protein
VVFQGADTSDTFIVTVIVNKWDACGLRGAAD